MPEDLRITKILFAYVEHRIGRESRPRASAIIAIGNVLVLKRLFGVMGGVDRDERRLAAFSKAARVLPVNHGAAGKNHEIIFLAESHGQMLPLNEVLADRMAPTHVPPFIAKGIELIEEVIFAVIKYHPVRVIHPVGRRREVK